MQDQARPEVSGPVSVTVPSVDRRPPGPDRTRQGLTDLARRMVVAVLITVLILGVSYFLWRGAHVLLQAFAGVLFAVFLSALSDLVHKHTRLSYGWSLAVVVLGLTLIVGVSGYFMWNRLSDQVGELMQTLPRSLDRIRS